MGGPGRLILALVLLALQRWGRAVDIVAVSLLGAVSVIMSVRNWETVVPMCATHVVFAAPGPVEAHLFVPTLIGDRMLSDRENHSG